MANAKYWRKLDDGRVACELCPQACVIAEGRRGICLGRENRDGILVAANYAQCVSAQVDPVEKKPLYHVCPGREVLSVACNGCNLRCDFCQNWSIAQQPASTTPLPPERLVDLALERGSFGIAFTYTEPLIWFEYLLDAGALAREQGLKNILVTNGVLNEQPLVELLPLVDAMNIDLKSMDRDFYRKYCHVDGLESVKRTIRLGAEHSFVEVTNLMIPGLNDSDEQIRELVDFMADVDRAVPVHFSAYYPTHKMTIEPTPYETLERASSLAKEKLLYVYVGNVSGGDSNTYCPNCGNLQVRRSGYSAKVVGIVAGDCSRCGRTADFVWCEG